MKITKMFLATAALVLIPACNEPDERLSRLAQESTREQSQQNQAMADATRTVSENHRRVVEAVESSRRELTAFERDVRRQAEQLDQERRDFATNRQKESLLVPIVETLGAVLVSALPLVICLYLLHGLRYQPTDDEANEVVLQWFKENYHQDRLAGQEPHQNATRQVARTLR